MTFHPTRYYHITLLIWAVLALVLNPLSHALGHCHIDHYHQDFTPGSTGTYWIEAEMCPHCDAVFHYSIVSYTNVPNRAHLLLWEIEPYSVRHGAQEVLLPICSRAPPVQV